MGNPDAILTGIVLKTVQGYFRRSLRPKPHLFPVMNTVNDGTQEKMPATIETLSRRQRLLALIFKWADADTMHDCDRRLLMTCSSQSAEACSAFPRCTRLPGLVTAVQIAAMLNTRDLAFSTLLGRRQQRDEWKIFSKPDGLFTGIFQ